MKFIMFLLPSIPATREERRSERPVSANTDRFQQMLGEVVELARMAEGYGFEIVSTTEHHLHTEGLEMGHVPSLNAHIAMHTSEIMVGPLGYVLPSWNPLRLAIEIGWLDQLTRGRTIVGMAKGYQSRWVNQMTQHLGFGADPGNEGKSRAFDEVYEFLKLAWVGEPFAFDGEFWQFPYPTGTGTPWPAVGWTEEYGAPGEVVDGHVRKITVVPQPFQEPHPPLFAAFTASDSTVAWAAREGVTPVILGSSVERTTALAEMYKREAAAAGRERRLGEGLAVSHMTVFGDDVQDAYKRARRGRTGTYYTDFGGVFGFWEGFRLPGDEERWPRGQVPLPESERTMDRMARAGHLNAGTAGDVRRRMDALVEAVDPEYFVYGPDQGVTPFEECKRQLRIFGEQVMPHYRDS